jgi:hypothetical protein
VLTIAQKLNHHEGQHDLDLKKASLPASTVSGPQPLSKELESENRTPTDNIMSKAPKTPLSDSAPIAEEREPSVQRTAPCKLLTRFAAGANADIARERDGVDEELVTDEKGGVECSRAYRMLRGFATTDAKLDSIAYTLENGCERTTHGCRVRNENIWKALDQAME